MLAALLVVSGCSVFGLGSKIPAQKAEEKNRAKVTAVEQAQKHNQSDKMNQIGELAYGTDYALGKLTNAPREVVVAKDMNQRVISIAGSPTVEKMKEMQAMIDKLTSEIELTRKKGAESLLMKDLEIKEIQEQSKILSDRKDAEISNYMEKARIAAANSDAYKNALEEYEGWFGLKAVGKGLWQFIKTSAWALGIGSVLFFILRLASYSNPLAASIFSIFETVASWAVNAIKLIVPKAVDVAGHVTKGAFNLYKSTLTKVIDGVQIAKERAKASGKEPSIEEALDEIAKSMDGDEKAIILELKKALHWK